MINSLKPIVSLEPGSHMNNHLTTLLFDNRFGASPKAKQEIQNIFLP